MNLKNKEIFLERAKQYFGEDYDRFVSLINEKQSSGFFINEKKADKDKIFEIIDFSYKEWNINNNSYYCLSDSIGKSKAYELGIIYPQDVESSMPVSFLENNDISLAIDLCAAPGGKSINALNKLNDNCLFISNDVTYSRASILSSNLERCGFTNTIVTSLKPDYLASKYQGLFDLVILDAPCSGEGMIRKYPEILDTYSISNIENLANIQKDLLEDAYKLLNEGGTLIYSTCTFAFEEDENQVKDFLNRHEDMELIKHHFDHNSSKLDGTIKLSFLNNTEGQFMAFMKKKGTLISKKYKQKKTSKHNIVEKFIKDNLNIENYYLYNNENNYYLSLIPLIDIEYGLLRYGIYLGELKKDRFEPSHNLYRSNNLSFKYQYSLNDEEYYKFIRGDELSIDKEDNYYQVTYKGLSLGFGKCAKGKLKNKYPKGLRRVI